VWRRLLVTYPEVSQPDGTPVRDSVSIAIDIANVTFS
jgi:hypothetical protein